MEHVSTSPESSHIHNPNVLEVAWDDHRNCNKHIEMEEALPGDCKIKKSFDVFGLNL
jgi:hypothetical protein